MSLPLPRAERHIQGTEMKILVGYKRVVDYNVRIQVSLTAPAW